MRGCLLLLILLLSIQIYGDLILERPFCREIITEECIGTVFLDMPVEISIAELESMDVESLKGRGFENVGTLSLIQTDLEKVDERVFSLLSNVESVSIEASELSIKDFEVLKKFSKLNRLVFDSCKFEFMYLSLPNLEWLTFSNMPLSQLRPESFRGLKKLMGLKLSQHEISNLQKGFFDEMPNLRFLDISSPHLEYIPDQMFVNLDHLVNLNVADAPLTRTNKAAFVGVPQIRGLPPTFDVSNVVDWAP